MRQPNAKRRDVRNQKEHNDHWNVEDDNTFRDRLHRHLSDRAADHHGRANWRREQADAEIENHDDAEMHRVDAEGLDHRQEYRRADQQHRRQIHERAEQQQQDVDPEQEHVFVAGNIDEEFRRDRRHLQQRHHVAERNRKADHDHDHAHRADDTADQFRNLAPFDVAIDEHRHKERVDARDRARFRRCKYAGQDAAENNDDGDHTPNSVERDLADLTERDLLAFREIVAARDVQNEDDQRQPEQ